jgi:hypothetical protein
VPVNRIAQMEHPQRMIELMREKIQQAGADALELNVY